MIMAKGRKLVSTITLPAAEVREAMLDYMKLKGIETPPGDMIDVSEETKPNEFAPHPVGTGSLVLTWITKKL